MKNRTWSLLVFLAFLLIGPVAGAQPKTFIVEYVLGTAEYRSGSVWKPCFEGDSLPVDALLRIGNRSILELRQGDRRLSIVREGTYAISSLAAPRPARPGLAETLVRKLRTLVESDGTSITVAGVRATEVLGTGFYASGGDDAKRSGLAAMGSGDYALAVEQFAYALAEAVTPAEEDELRILLAAVQALDDRPGAALGTLRAIADPVPASKLLEASILLKAGDALEALSLARSVTAAQVSPIQASEAAELEGLALEAEGRTTEAVEAYRRASAAAPGSRSAARSEERLQALGA